MPVSGSPVTSSGAPLRQAEIQLLDPLFRDQNIGGLQIAVAEPFAMRRDQGFENVPGVFDRFLRWQRTLELHAVDQYTDAFATMNFVRFRAPCNGRLQTPPGLEGSNGSGLPRVPRITRSLAY